MSLQTRLDALITAVGADIKALQGNSATPSFYNASTASQNFPGVGNTQIDGSLISIPNGKIKVGTTYRCRFNATKTAAGTSSPAFGVRIGTTGTISDPTRVGLNGGTTSAAVDEGFVEIEAVFRVIGASAIMQMTSKISHRLATTGLAVVRQAVAVATGPTWDSTVSDLKISTALGVGSTSNWTLDLVTAELSNLA